METLGLDPEQPEPELLDYRHQHQNHSRYCTTLGTWSLGVHDGHGDGVAEGVAEGNGVLAGM